MSLSTSSRGPRMKRRIFGFLEEGSYHKYTGEV
jgi:hypothetical protein